MIVGIGLDSLEIARMRDSMKKERFLNRVFTEDERSYIKSKAVPEQSAAGIFCVKEAVLKSIEMGIGSAKFTDVEVLHEKNGAPYALLHGDLKQYGKVLISITHTKDTASAFAVRIQEDER